MTACSILPAAATGSRLTLDASGAQLQGAHNIENMLAAGSVGFLCGLSAEVIRDTLISFTGLPHRMEFVDEIRGVKFFNDSKGTNVGAVVKSLESLEGPIILIAGGKDKGGSYRPLEALLAEQRQGPGGAGRGPRADSSRARPCRANDHCRFA